jgi:hypothetical protein
VHPTPDLSLSAAGGGASPHAASQADSSPAAAHAASHAPGPAAAAHVARTAVWALGVLADPGRRPPAVLHPLGFLCFPLLRAPGVGVCVHVWLPGRSEFTPPLATSPIHAHSWDLVSFVLLGRIGNEVVRTEPAEPDAATHRIYEIRSAGGADEVVPTGHCVRCVREEIRYTGAGGVYRLPDGEFHSSVVDEGSGAATVLLADSRGGRDRALGPLRPSGAPGRVPRRHAPAALAKLAAQTVLAVPFPAPAARTPEEPWRSR